MNPTKKASSPITAASATPDFVRPNQFNDHNAASSDASAPAPAFGSPGSAIASATPSGIPANDPTIPAKNGSVFARRTNHAMLSIRIPTIASIDAASNCDGSSPSTRTNVAKPAATSNTPPSTYNAIRIGKR
ncbi:MAG: hypothetical protein ACKOBR_08705 [Actinomycetota bacterium]